jgi:hypothetical protein
MPGAPADWDSLRSPENYTGYARTENLASPGGAILGQRHACTAPPQLRRNHWALSGDWTMEQQATTLNAASGRSSTASMPATCTWSWDPRPRRRPYGSASFSTDSPGRHHGTDVDDQGDGTVTEPRLHQLIRQPGPVSDRTFEITFLDPGVQAYCFTFG